MGRHADWAKSGKARNSKTNLGARYPKIVPICKEILEAMRDDNSVCLSINQIHAYLVSRANGDRAEALAAESAAEGG